MSARRHSHAMAHAWELELKSWYNDMQDPGGEEETEDEAEHDPEKMTAEEALAELGDMLIDFKMQGTLHATHVCVLCFWASKAGLGGIVSRLAKAPGGSSGNYAKHFNRTIGADLNDDDSLYAVDVPSFKRGHMGRSSQEIAMYPHMKPQMTRSTTRQTCQICLRRAWSGTSCLNHTLTTTSRARRRTAHPFTHLRFTQMRLSSSAQTACSACGWCRC